MKPFDGRTASRPDLSTYRAPDHEDYMALVREIAATQRYVTNLGQGMVTIPNLDGTLTAAKKKIEELESQLEKLAVPADVMARLEELEASHLQLDSRAHVARLAHNNDLTKAELVKSQLQVAKMQAEFVTEVRQFQNKIWGSLNEFKEATQQRLQALEAKVEQLGTGVELNALLAKLKG